MLSFIYRFFGCLYDRPIDLPNGQSLGIYQQKSNEKILDTAWSANRKRTGTQYPQEDFCSNLRNLKKYSNKGWKLDISIDSKIRDV